MLLIVNLLVEIGILFTGAYIAVKAMQMIFMIRSIDLIFSFILCALTGAEEGHSDDIDDLNEIWGQRRLDRW